VPYQEGSVRNVGLSFAREYQNRRGVVKTKSTIDFVFRVAREVDNFLASDRAPLPLSSYYSLRGALPDTNQPNRPPLFGAQGVTMSSGKLSEVTLLNMNFLTTLQAMASRDPVIAAYAFGLTIDDVRVIAAMSVDGLQKLACSVDRSMFALRPSVQEIRELANMPGPIAWLHNALAPAPIPRAMAGTFAGTVDSYISA